MRDDQDRVEESYAESEKVWNIFEVSDSNSELYTKEELITNKKQTVVRNKILVQELDHSSKIKGCWTVYIRAKRLEVAQDRELSFSLYEELLKSQKVASDETGLGFEICSASKSKRVYCILQAFIL